MPRSRANNALVPALAMFLAASNARAVPRSGPAALPTGPSPVSFSIAPVPGTSQWRWSLRNDSGAAVEVATDRRLVWIEAAGGTGRRRGARARCTFETRPSSAEDVVRTSLTPGQRYSELVDVRDVCRLHVPASMAPGSSVVAHYGFDSLATRGRPSRARWMSRTIAFDERAYPVNDLSATVSVPEGEVPAAPSPTATVTAGPAAPTVVGRDAQAAFGDGLRASVRLSNDTSMPLWTLMRTVLFSFRLETPSGRTVTCDSLAREPSPFRELFVRLGPHAARGIALTPYEFCPVGAFDEAGLYRARVVFESSADGDPWARGRVFTGRIVSAPFVFRIGRGRARYRPAGLEISG